MECNKKSRPLKFTVLAYDLCIPLRLSPLWRALTLYKLVIGLLYYVDLCPLLVEQTRARCPRVGFFPCVWYRIRTNEWDPIKRNNKNIVASSIETLHWSYWESCSVNSSLTALTRTFMDSIALKKKKISLISLIYLLNLVVTTGNTMNKTFDWRYSTSMQFYKRIKSSSHYLAVFLY